MRSQFKISALAAAAVAVGGVVWWQATSPPEAAQLSSPTANEKGPTPNDNGLVAAADIGREEPTVSVATSHAPPPALSGRYALDYALEMKGTNANATSATLALQGTLVAALDSASDDDGVRWLWAKLEQPQVQLNATMAKLIAFGEDPRADLSHPFAIRLLPNGRIDDVRFVDGQSTAARATLANIAQAAQLAANPEQAKSEVSEWSLNGDVSASIRHPQDSTYLKVWKRDHRVGMQSGDSDTAQSARGEVTLAVDADVIESIRSREEGRTHVGQQAQPSYTIDVTLAREGKAPSKVASNVSRKDVAPLVPELLDVKLPEEPMVSFAQAIENVEQAGRVAHKRAPARRQLARVIAEVPGTAKKVAQRFALLTTAPATRLTLIESLAGARGREGQQAMADLLADETLDEPLRIQVVGAIVAVPNPEDLLLNSLEEAAYRNPDRVYASKVAMVLGASLALRAENDPEGAVQRLGPYLNRAAEVLSPVAEDEPQRIEERSNWLGGLGNVGSPNALPLILDGLADRREEIRAAAAHALRFQDPPTVYERMQQLMHQDASMPVRLGVLHSAHLMGPTVTKGLVERSLHYDTSENVRMEAAYVIASWMQDAPGLRQILAHALEGESSEKVRHTLRNYLEPGRVAAPVREIPSTNPLIPEGYQSESP